jgi:hypothetical protein
MTFHNTINYLPSQVIEEEKKIIKASEAILMMFQAHPDRWFTPWEIHELFEGKLLITSVRRSITDLESDKELIKSEHLVKERMGKPNYQWKLRQSK